MCINNLALNLSTMINTKFVLYWVERLNVGNKFSNS